MRTLIYKRTHSGDPDPNTGVFGNHDCMGGVRGWPFDAVIGIGGVGQEPQSHLIAGKLTWVGIGPQVIDHTARGPQLIFHHFWYRGDEGPLLQKKYPGLASRMYGKNVKVLLHSQSPSQHTAKSLPWIVRSKKFFVLRRTRRLRADWLTETWENRGVGAQCSPIAPAGKYPPGRAQYTSSRPTRRSRLPRATRSPEGRSSRRSRPHANSRRRSSWRSLIGSPATCISSPA